MIDDLGIWDELEDDFEEDNDLNLFGDLDDYFEDVIYFAIKYIYIPNPKYSVKKDYIMYKN